jgi:pectate lyase
LILRFGLQSIRRKTKMNRRGIGIGISVIQFVGFLAMAADAPPASIPRQPLAFPSAEGFGARVTGGRGGEVYHVTNLNDAGPGSFRDAVSQGRRTVIFDVGGIIKLAANVSVSSDITIAGQTAPGDGIAIYGRTVSLSGATNVIVRYLRFRQGISGDRGKCSINLAGGSHMIFDHVSIQWGRWDSLGVTQGSHTMTFQNCMIGEAIDPQRFGALVDSVTHITLSHNLWHNNQSRNPKAKGTIQYINNVVYNWGGTGLVGGHSAADHQLDVINNYFIKGPASNDRFVGQFTATDKVCQKGNYVDLDRDGQLNGRAVVEADYTDSGGAPSFAATPFLNPPVPVTVDTARVAYQKVVAGAGCSLRRDTVDARIITELTSLGKQGRISRDEAEVGGMGEIKGGPAPVSRNGDGIPDDWKIAHGLDPNDPNVRNGDYNRDGYTNLEKYLNELAGDVPVK